MTRRDLFIASVALIAANVLIGGCPLLGLAAAMGRNPYRTIEALYDLSGKSVAVIPFSYQDIVQRASHPPFTSEHGMLLAETIEKELLAHVELVQIVPAERAEWYLRDSPEGRVDYGRLAKMLGADVVIFGEIGNIRLADEMNRVTAEVLVKAYDAEQGSIVVKENLTTRFKELDRGVAIRGLMTASGRAAARLFYEHEVRNRPGGVSYSETE